MLRSSGERRSSSKNGSAAKAQKAVPAGVFNEGMICQEGSSVLDLNGENYFSCTVGRKCSSARYSLDSAEEVVHFFQELARKNQAG